MLSWESQGQGAKHEKTYFLTPVEIREFEDTGESSLSGLSYLNEWGEEG